MKALSIYPDSQGRTQLEKAIALRTDVTLCRSFSEVPDPETLACALRAWAPSIIFLDLRHPEIPQICGLLTAEFPGIRKVAIHPSQSPEVFRRLLHMGMCELVNPPFEPMLFDTVMDRLLADLQEHPGPVSLGCHVSAYLPAKAGVGASTLAAHMTWAAAENREERVLLADLDSHSGMTAFQFDLQTTYTVHDAIANSGQLDEDSWRRLVSTRGNMDFLLSRPGTIQDLNPEVSAGPLLTYAQRHYSTIHLDLPDSFDPLTLSGLHQADQVFLVTTTDLTALRLARLKAYTLRKLDLQGRTRLILNRVDSNSGLSLEDISRAVGLDVYATFPSDYIGVCESIRCAKPNPQLLKKARELFHRVNGTESAPAPPPKKSGFLSRLAVPIASYL